MENQNSNSKKHFLDSIPAPGLVLLAIVAIQLGAAIATHLFPILGAEGTVAFRIILAAVLLCIITRGKLPSLVSAFTAHWRLLLPFGLCIAAMNMFFYKAIALIPLGVAVALEFIGPLSVAALSSRKWSHFGWVTLASIGIALLSPFSGIDLDPFGVGYALLAGAGWAFFIIFATRIGDNVTGSDGLVIGMSIAAICMLPIAIPLVPTLILDPLILLAVFGVAILSTTIPFSFEFIALKRLSTRTYGILVSIEPAVAAIIGAALLGEHIGVQSTIAIACVVIAAIGISMTDDKADQDLQ